MRRFVFLAFAAALPLSGCTGKAPSLTGTLPALKDEDSLQGTWIVVSMERDGDKQDLSDEKDEKKQITVVVNGNIMKMKLGDLESKDDDATFKLDPGQKPKHIDMTRKKTDLMSSSVEKKVQTTKCIFELEGDNLRICGPIEDDGERPKEFTGAKDKKTVLMTFKRK